jgi:hypothetical protein
LLVEAKRQKLIVMVLGEKTANYVGTVSIKSRKVYDLV